MGQKA